MQKNKSFIVFSVACLLLGVPCYLYNGAGGMIPAVLASAAWLVRYLID